MIGSLLAYLSRTVVAQSHGCLVTKSCNWIIGHLCHSHINYASVHGFPHHVSYSFSKLWKLLLTSRIKRSSQKIFFLISQNLVISNWISCHTIQREINCARNFKLALCCWFGNNLVRVWDYSLNCTSLSRNTITKYYKIFSLVFCNVMTPKQMIVGT